MRKDEIDTEDFNMMLKDIEERLSRMEEGNEELQASEHEYKSEFERQLSLFGNYQFSSGPPYYLKLDISDMHLRERILGVRGQLSRNEDSTLTFWDKENRSSKAMNLPILEVDSRLLPLLNYLQEDAYPVDFIGECDDDLHMLSVYSIHIVPERKRAQQISAFKFRMKDELLQHFLKYLFSTESMYPVSSRDEGRRAFTSFGELKALFTICRSKYPPNLQSWAENQIKLYESGIFSSTDKQHIVLALSYILNVDWSLTQPDVPELTEVRRILDDEFYGLDAVKQRILEIAAQIRVTHKLPKWGILLCGPAGVGKTSISNSIARILHMKKGYVEFSVVRDDESLSGTSRIYGNAQPGMILNQIYEQGTATLLMHLGEIDKATGGKDRGNPLDVLLPLLDGMGFTDNFIGATIPTTGMFFVATCNDIAAISSPVLDRFYIIEIPQYSRKEKEVIFDRYLFPKFLQQVGASKAEISLDTEARDTLFTQYATAPGVRDLEKYAEKLISNYMLLKELKSVKRHVYNARQLRAVLGPVPSYSSPFAMFPGIAHGAYIHNGHLQAFQIQTIVRPGNGRISFTNIPSPYQEDYCRIAYECVCKLTRYNLTDYDVIISASHPLPLDRANYLGCAVCAALISAIQATPLSASEIFLGGCDLFGNIRLDEISLDPYLRSLSGQYQTLYGPIGISELLYERHQDCHMNIIETPNIAILLELVASRNEGMRGGQF